MESEFIVRQYRTSDAKDLLEKEYPFDDTGEFGSWYKDVKLKIINFLEGRRRQRFVVYSLKEKKVVSTCKVDSITKSVWHGGAYFTIPSHRKRGLTRLLVKYMDEYQKRFGATRRVGNIELTNFPSIISFAKIGSKFIPQSYYQCDGALLENQIMNRLEDGEKIELAGSRRSDRGKLYGVYQKCTIDEWRNILDIGKDDFLERFFGWTRMRGLFKLWIRNKVVNVKENGDIIGYFHYTTKLVSREKPKHKRVYLYLLSSERITSILRKILDLLKGEGYKEISLVFTNTDKVFMEKMANTLQDDFHFKKRKFLIGYRFLK